MAVALLGADALDALLDSDPRVVVSNRTIMPSRLTILAAIVVLHDEDGSTQLKVAYDLNLESGDARFLEAFAPTAKAILAAEARLRVLAGDEGRMLDVYATVEADPAVPLRTVVFGVTNASDSDEPSATPIAEAPDFAVFARFAS